MIALRQMAELDLSAASGLVQLGAHVLVVADDEHFLDTYALSTGRRVSRTAIGLAPPLPDEHHERKRLKPDLESLAALPDGSVLALGSGSAANRCTGYVVAPQTATVRTIDLGPLYRSLLERLPELNIEGAAVGGPWLRLLQRGNGAAGANAVIDLDLSRTLAAMRTGVVGPDLVVAVRPVALGTLEGVPLGFTDASPLDPAQPRLAFSAAAEDTDDPYEDGACTGSVLGVLDAEGHVEWTEPVEGHHKIEGLVVGEEMTLLVADPDDRSKRAPLFSTGAVAWRRAV